MKLLSWMHRKLEKDTTGSFKGTAIGSSCLLLKQSPTNQEDYARPGHNSKLRPQPQYQTQHHLEKFEAEKTEEIDKEDSTEIFPGFLTIGTLSVEPITEPSTPTFDFADQITDEDGMPEMKHDLKLINKELEKFLNSEAVKEGGNEMSDRKSQASTFTTIDKEKEEMGEYKYEEMQAYPLQGYLLGSSTELLERKQKTKKEKKSLKEVIQNIRTAIRSPDKKAELAQTKKEVKPSTNLMNEMLQTPPTSHNKTTACTGCAAESFPPVKKLNKIKRLFHKKIHPETSSTTKDPKKFSKCETKKILNDSGPSYPNSALSCSNRMGSWCILMKGENHQSKSNMKLSQDSATKKKSYLPPKEQTSGAGREHWINTDEDYLVLELQQNEEIYF